MKFLFRLLGCWLLCAPMALVSLAQAPKGRGSEHWQHLDEVPANRLNAEPWVQPQSFRAYHLDRAGLKQSLATAPREFSAAARTTNGPIELTLPMPDGTEARYRLVESPVMPDELAAKYPEIKTYSGTGIDDPQAHVRIDVTPAGFHAQVLSPKGAVYIDPMWRGDAEHYAVYYKRDHHKKEDWKCFTEGKDAAAADATTTTTATAQRSLASSGPTLRTYRLACAATAEYTQFQGGTVSAGLAAVVTAVNRVTGVYETELGIRLTLVANNDLLIYTNSTTDPYNNSNPSSLLTQNQSNCDTVISNANYDIGHVFSTAGGGLAGLGVVCVSGQKARGETGTSSPVGDGFYIDYVAHEMGHQFGANHTFNSSTGSCGGGNRVAAAAYEPGSGSTIMAYAGICGADDLQAHSDPYFLFYSYTEIENYITTGSGNSCAVQTSTGNTAPNVTTAPSFTVPANTYFMLTAAGSDPNGQSVTYCWEERDLGPSTTLTAVDNGSSPLFRSFNPTTNTTRAFPQWSDILNNTTTGGEKLPSTERTNNFRVTVRDNLGGVNFADTVVIFKTNSGPFRVTSPNTAVNWSGSQTITWSVAGTTNAPISATNVDIFLSTDGGATWAYTLATGTPNDGSQSVLLPNITTTNARIMVKASNSIFFDVSDVNFTITPYTPAPFVIFSNSTVTAESCLPANNAVDPSEVVTMDVALANTGTSNTTSLVATLLSGNGVVNPSGAQNYGVLNANGATVSRAYSFTANGSCGSTIQCVFQLQDGATSLGFVTNFIVLGVPTFSTKSFTNTTSISIGPSAGSGSPYGNPGANINISGLTGTVSKLTVSLNGLTHGNLSDVDILLVGPTGAKTLLISDAGVSKSVTSLTFTLDDTAASTLSQTGTPVSGTYQPTDYDTASDTFASPAPSGPYNASLSQFIGTSPNGNWILYVRDDTSSSSGTLAGWTLNFTLQNYTCCTIPVADLQLTAVDAPDPVAVGSNLTYTVTVTNLGPVNTTGVFVTNNLTPGFNYVGASPSQGSVSTSSGQVLWNVGSLNFGAGATLAFTVTPTGNGTFTNGIIAISSVTDSNSTNNSTNLTTTVTLPPSISDIPDQTINEDITLGPIPFTVSDGDTTLSSLNLTGTSSNTNLVPNANISITGTTGSRNLTIKPATNQSGTATITVKVSDGVGSATDTFVLTVNPTNDVPTLVTSFGAQSTLEDVALTGLAFTIGDVETPASALILTATAADTNLVPNVNLTISGSNSNRTLSILPGTNQFGSTVITLSVSDGTNTVSTNFNLTVTSVNDAPTLDAISNLVLIPIAGPQTINLTGITSGATNENQTLTLTAVSDNESVISNLVVTYTSPNTTGTLDFTPSSNQTGTATITVTVTDDGGTANGGTNAVVRKFTVTHEYPLLVIALTNGSAVVSWPTVATNFVLESTTNLAPTIVWTTVPGSPVVVGSQNYLTNPLAGTNTFFRLHKP